MLSPITGRTAFTSAGLAMLGTSLAAESKTSSGDEHRLNVRAFGAKADQATDDTAAFQAAIDAAAASGRGNVEWTGWSPENAIKIAWRDWGQQVRVLPQPNLASPRYVDAMCASSTGKAGPRTPASRKAFTKSSLAANRVASASTESKNLPRSHSGSHCPTFTAPSYESVPCRSPKPSVHVHRLHYIPLARTRHLPTLTQLPHRGALLQVLRPSHCPRYLRQQGFPRLGYSMTASLKRAGGGAPEQVGAFATAKAANGIKTKLTADGRANIASKRRELIIYFHVVPSAIPVSAVTMPQAMISPLVVSLQNN